MINLLKRLWAFLLGKANSGMDQIEDPIELAELKISNMKADQGKLIEAVAQIKAISIRHKTDAENFQNESDSYLEKAKKLKARYEAEEDNREELKKYITIALNKHENLKLEAKKFTTLKEEQDKKVEALEGKTKTFIDTIKKSESDLKILKAQTKASKVNKKFSKELSEFNFDGVGNLLNEIEETVVSNNIEAESWMQVGDDLKSDEQKMEDLLAKDSPSDDSKLFSDFMETAK